VSTHKKPVKKPAATPKGKPRSIATAAAILGHVAGKNSKSSNTSFTPRPNVKIKSKWAKYYQALLNIRERLVHQMSGLAKDSAEEMPSYSLHMADSGTDNFDRDFTLSLLSSDQDAVYEIEEALKRIEKDVYGICELTGKTIPEDRLEAIPWTRFTVEAQDKLEREGALRQKRLGALGTVDSAGSNEAEESDDEPEEKPAKEKE